MDAGSQVRTPAELAFDRHGKMRKVIGAATVLLVLGSVVAGPQVGIPLLIASMACFVLAAWHQVLYSKGKRDRAAVTS